MANWRLDSWTSFWSNGQNRVHPESRWPKRVGCANLHALRLQADTSRPLRQTDPSEDPISKTSWRHFILETRLRTW